MSKQRQFWVILDTDRRNKFYGKNVLFIYLKNDYWVYYVYSK